MELVKLKGNTYILESLNRVGIYVVNENEAIVIDTGVSPDDGKKIMEICASQGWQIKMILNTHAHPDHIGGNQIIQETLGVPIYAVGAEKTIIERPLLLGMMAGGGYPPKFIEANYPFPAGSKAEELTEAVLPEGLELIHLPGHSENMVGFKTADGVVFLGDAVTGMSYLQRYKLQFMFDAKAYLNTFNKLESLKGEIFVPSHGEYVEGSLTELVEANLQSFLEVLSVILMQIIEEKNTYEEILNGVATYYGIKINLTKEMVIGTTIKCSLVYLIEKGFVNILPNERKFIGNEEKLPKDFTVANGVLLFQQ